MNSQSETAPLPCVAAADSAGMLLRRAREAQGLHIAALAVTLKVPVKKLEALENDQLDLLPDAVFARALASSVCRTLKLDRAPILNLLPGSAAPKLYLHEASSTVPFRREGTVMANAMPQHLTRPVLWAVLGLLVAAAGVFFWPQAPSPVAPVAVVKQAGLPSAVTQSVPVIASLPVQGGSDTLPELREKGTADVLAPIATGATVITPVAPVSQSQQMSAPEDLQILAVHTRGDSWVEVTDAQGVTVFRRTVARGESVVTGGKLPLSVVVGRADMTEILVRGKVFSLTPATKDNVARFEVK